MIILAKSALQKDQLDCKMKIGCDEIEIQLLAELVDGQLGRYKFAEDTFDLESFKDYPVGVVHAPLLSHYGLADVNLESFCDSDFKLLDQVFYIANWFGEKQNKRVIVVIHSEMDREYMKYVSDTWRTVLDGVGCLLFKYPYTELAIENVTPLRSSDLGKQAVHFCNNYYTDNVVMARELCKQLNTDRVGTVLDICHAIQAKKYIDAIYDEIEDVERPDFSLDAYFEANKDFIKLIHLASMKGSGYGKGKHGTAFTQENKELLESIIALYEKYDYSCKVTLEVEESDFLTSSNYKVTRETLLEVLEGYPNL